MELIHKTDCMCYECTVKHANNGCDYGRPEIDDVCKECDCGE